MLQDKIGFKKGYAMGTKITTQVYEEEMLNGK